MGHDIAYAAGKMVVRERERERERERVIIIIIFSYRIHKTRIILHMVI